MGRGRGRGHCLSHQAAYAMNTPKVATVTSANNASAIGLGFLSRKRLCASYLRGGAFLRRRLREGALQQAEQRVNRKRLDERALWAELLDARGRWPERGDHNHPGATHTGKRSMPQHLPAGLIRQIDIQQDHV